MGGNEAPNQWGGNGDEEVCRQCSTKAMQSEAGVGFAAQVFSDTQPVGHWHGKEMVFLLIH